MRIDDKLNTQYLTTGMDNRTRRYKKSNFFIVISLMLLLILLNGCNVNNSTSVILDNLNNESSNLNDAPDSNEKLSTSVIESIELDRKDTEEEQSDSTLQMIYGRWRLQEIVLISEAFDDVSKAAYSNFDFDSYLGTIVEYSDSFIVTEDITYDEPKYTHRMTTLGDYNNGGNYKAPDIYDFVISSEIHIKNSEDYEWLSEVPIEEIEIELKSEVYNPVITYVLVLNNDTILLGGWGKIILATRFTD